MKKRKNILTIELRPMIMASIKSQADRYSMTPRDWLETTLTTALMHPAGVTLKLDLSPLRLDPLVETEEPELALGGGDGNRAERMTRATQPGVPYDHQREGESMRGDAPACD